MTTRALGWKPSVPDIRDYKLHFASDAPIASEVDLRSTGLLPAVWDQQDIGSCVAHGVEAAYSFDLEKQGGTDNFLGSRLFLYYNGRVIEGTPQEDSGLTITDGVKALNQYGTPPESDWPYNTSLYTHKPPAAAYANGKLRLAAKYARVTQTQTAMQQCLTAGFPIVIGFAVYDSFPMDASNATEAIVPIPKTSESQLGGHCVLVVGYKLINGKFYWICRNSWGTGWGDKGYFYMPLVYLLDTNLADDFWVVQQVTSPDPTPVPPAPTPTPTPVPVDADSTLWGTVRDWAFARHLLTNKVAALAVQKWAKSKGFS